MLSRFTVVLALSVASVLPAVAKDVIWVEAEHFAEKGDWVVDTQFTHMMGSAYLLCPGADRPTTRPATTAVSVDEAGEYVAWVRTKDWLPEFSPGRFALMVNGRASSVLGASKKEGWRWERAGTFALKAGKNAVALKDLSGAYARCDAIVFAREAAYVPPEDGAALEKERQVRTGVSAEIADAGAFDVVVVGSGPGGMGAALGAARNGARVALVFDRPVPGGNASRECGIGFDGASLGRPNARESGVVEEIRLTRTYRGTDYTAAFEEMARHTPQLKLFANERVLRVEKNGAAVAAVLARNVLTGRWSRWRGRFFVDSTGDGWVAQFAGARMMYGREAGSAFGEEWIAPKVADRLTMSGKLSWGGGRDTGHPVSYETPVWARVMPKGFDRKVLNASAPWWLEAPGRFDDIDDPEAARDHMIRIDFGYWGWLKNEWQGRGKIASYEIVPPRGFNGRREGMRVTGDYVLTANDCRGARMFDDRVSYGGWSLDTHDPLGMDNPHGDGWWHPHSGVPIYSVPYRSIYSADVPNLFMGSRCQSMTHIALGSMRVQGTQMAAGQAAGTAAALCLEYGTDARGLGKDHIAALQQRLLKDDQYIPNLPNADPLDLARTAAVSATSTCAGSRPEMAVDGVARPVGDVPHGWISDPGRPLPQALTLTFVKPEKVGEVRLAFDSNLTPMRVKERMPSLLVRAYAVEGRVGDEWVVLADERENFLRHRVHRFAARTVSALRITVKSTWGDPSARIFEVRAYAGDGSVAGPVKTGRKLVWSDEFDGTGLDKAKWNFRRTMYGKDCQYANDARTVRVEDGCLHMRTLPSPDKGGRCLLSEGITTHDGMAWKYGYLEMRAKVPYRHGAWPSFWMQSTARYRKVDYLAEVDIFEAFSSTNAIAANIHKWGGGKHVMLKGGEGKGARSYRFADSSKLNDEFHVYGFEWNPNEMAFFVDGTCYYSCPIDEIHDFDVKQLPGMGGFHDFMFVIFNNEVFTPGHGWCPDGFELDGAQDLPIDYVIDWIRLWQDPRTEELKLR